MALSGGRPAGFAVRLGIVSAMLAIAIVSGTLVRGRVERVQQSVAGSVSSLPPDDPRRVEFERLHALSTGLMLVNIAGGLVLLVWNARA